MTEPRELVEHFFRHESGRLVAVLTRSLSVRRLELVEDVVQAALMQALETWSRRGVPDDPAGWLYRTARNLAIDALRREQTHGRALPHVADGIGQEAPPEAHFADEIGDEPLRLLFVCCHEAVPPESRVAFALRTLGGFSTAEIARGLLTTEANVQKRVERARDRLRELGVEFEAPQLRARLDAVLSVIYLLFSQGCHATHADVPIRRDLCDEARRLAKMLAENPIGGVPAVHALLALMSFHAARFDARVALDGGIVLFEDQDRSAWNWGDVREGMAWLARSATGEELTRYHVEAGIAWEHCRAPTFADTDWRRISEGYELLGRIAPSPVHALNRAVAEAHLHGPQAGLERLAAVDPEDIPARYPGWHAVIGELHFRLGQYDAAELAWREALRLSSASADQDFLSRRIAECRCLLGPAT
ncbi:RNA polymerase sigma factor [Limnoglobus roseus]|uniref:RNA polymerase subunit sigma-70 n=1 Tax=Limnoglobus roseus TaxID=2598579 RepID=A0A5C1A952_9BACT|nr:sigma-70 family RNA polymerase sigma factor [Limnoglobus roseus]QEL15065.1 RNA polymerase subunit sigma-70 [Limnoglobus roseus]